jgi:hypothetical protein
MNNRTNKQSNIFSKYQRNEYQRSKYQLNIAKQISAQRISIVYREANILHHQIRKSSNFQINISGVNRLLKYQRNVYQLYIAKRISFIIKSDNLQIFKSTPQV